MSQESNVPQLTFKHDNESEYSKSSQEIEIKITNDQPIAKLNQHSSKGDTKKK